MKTWYTYNFNRLFLGIFSLLLIVTGCITVLHEQWLNQLVVPASIISFSTLYYSRYPYFNVSFVSFLFFSISAEALGFLFFETEYYYISYFAYSLAFVSLVNLAVQKFKITEVTKLVGTYLIMVLVVGLFFLFKISNALRTIILGDFEMYMFIAKSLTLMVLSFVAFGVCLNTQAKLPIFFLAAVACFGFSVTLDFIDLYYVSHWSFVLLGKVFFVSGLYLMFAYYIEKNKVKRLMPIKQIEVNYSEITFA